MAKKSLLFLLVFFFVASVVISAHPRSVKTVIKDQTAKAMLVGAHRLSLQWISWDYFGKAVVTEKNGTLSITGEQRAKKGSDYLCIEGTITEVSAKEFIFNGVVEMRVSHINKGEPCKREGELTFVIKGNRRYWRMQQMDNPCDEATDYVDIYFR